MNLESEGEFVKEDFKTYNKFYEMIDSNDAKTYQKQLLSERLKQFSDNPVLIPVHIYHKFRKRIRY